LFAFQNVEKFGLELFRERTAMDVAKMLADLRQEREQIEEAILSLERLARGRGKRRGRPPAWMQEVKKRGRPPGSKNKSKNEAKPSVAKAMAAA
jgi:DNA invertase Pin-like site-specific DNA recombinase